MNWEESAVSPHVKDFTYRPRNETESQKHKTTLFDHFYSTSFQEKSQELILPILKLQPHSLVHVHQKTCAKTQMLSVSTEHVCATILTTTRTTSVVSYITLMTVGIKRTQF